jgi:hypothetical protein
MQPGDRLPQRVSQPRWEKKCPICRRERGVDHEFRPGYISIRCKSCGEYEIEAELSDTFRELHYADPDYRLCRYLGCYTRQRAEIGECAQIRLAEWRDLASKYQNKRVTCKLDKLLGILAKRCGAPGRYSQFDPGPDGCLIDEPWPDSFGRYVNQLVSNGDVEFEPSDDEVPQRCTVTVTGWLRLQSLPQAPEGTEVSDTRSSILISQSRGKPGPKPIDLKHRDAMTKIIASYEGDWSSESNLVSVCQGLDAAKVPLPKKWGSRESLPKSWKTERQPANSWSNALALGGREPVAKVIRERIRDGSKSS